MTNTFVSASNNKTQASSPSFFTMSQSRPLWRRRLSAYLPIRSLVMMLMVVLPLATLAQPSHIKDSLNTNDTQDDIVPLGFKHIRIDGALYCITSFIGKGSAGTVYGAIPGECVRRSRKYGSPKPTTMMNEGGQTGSHHYRNKTRYVDPICPSNALSDAVVVKVIRLMEEKGASTSKEARERQRDEDEDVDVDVNVDGAIDRHRRRCLGTLKTLTLSRIINDYYQNISSGGMLGCVNPHSLSIRNPLAIVMGVGYCQKCRSTPTNESTRVTNDTFRGGVEELDMTDCVEPCGSRGCDRSGSGLHVDQRGNSRRGLSEAIRWLEKEGACNPVMDDYANKATNFQKNQGKRPSDTSTSQNLNEKGQRMGSLGREECPGCSHVILMFTRGGMSVYNYLYPFPSSFPSASASPGSSNLITPVDNRSCPNTKQASEGEQCAKTGSVYGTRSDEGTSASSLDTTKRLSRGLVARGYTRDWRSPWGYQNCHEGTEEAMATANALRVPSNRNKGYALPHLVHLYLPAGEENMSARGDKGVAGQGSGSNTAPDHPAYSEDLVYALAPAIPQSSQTRSHLNDNLLENTKRITSEADSIPIWPSSPSRPSTSMPSTSSSSWRGRSHLLDSRTMTLCLVLASMLDAIHRMHDIRLYPLDEPSLARTEQKVRNGHEVISLAHMDIKLDNLVSKCISTREGNGNIFESESSSPREDGSDKANLPMVHELACLHSWLPPMPCLVETLTGTGKDITRGSTTQSSLDLIHASVLPSPSTIPTPSPPSLRPVSFNTLTTSTNFHSNQVGSQAGHRRRIHVYLHNSNVTNVTNTGEKIPGHTSALVTNASNANVHLSNLPTPTYVDNHLYSSNNGNVESTQKSLPMYESTHHHQQNTMVCEVPSSLPLLTTIVDIESMVLLNQTINSPSIASGSFDKETPNTDRSTLSSPLLSPESLTDEYVTQHNLAPELSMWLLPQWVSENNPLSWDRLHRQALNMTRSLSKASLLRYYVTQGADLYAMGVTAFELIIGQETGTAGPKGESKAKREQGGLRVDMMGLTRDEERIAHRIASRIIQAFRSMARALNARHETSQRDLTNGLGEVVRYLDYPCGISPLLRQRQSNGLKLHSQVQAKQTVTEGTNAASGLAYTTLCGQVNEVISVLSEDEVLDHARRIVFAQRMTRCSTQTITERLRSLLDPKANTVEETMADEDDNSSSIKVEMIEGIRGLLASKPEHRSTAKVARDYFATGMNQHFIPHSHGKASHLPINPDRKRLEEVFTREWGDINNCP